MTFRGLRSRWTMPARCAVSSADAICIAQSSASSNGKRSLRKPVGECLTVQKLHDEVGHRALGSRAAVGADVVERADVRVIQSGNDACFALETLTRGFVDGDVGPQHFDRDGPPQSSVAGPVDLAHPAAADAGFQMIRTELRACRGPRPATPRCSPRTPFRGNPGRVRGRRAASRSGRGTPRPRGRPPQRTACARRQAASSARSKTSRTPRHSSGRSEFMTSDDEGSDSNPSRSRGRLPAPSRRRAHRAMSRVTAERAARTRHSQRREASSAAWRSWTGCVRRRLDCWR